MESACADIHPRMQSGYTAILTKNMEVSFSSSAASSKASSSESAAK